MNTKHITAAAMMAAAALGAALTFIPAFAKVRSVGEIMLLVGVGGLIRTNPYVRRANQMQAEKLQSGARRRLVDVRVEAISYAAFFALFSAVMVLGAIGRFYPPLTDVMTVSLGLAVLVCFLNRVL